VSLLYVAQREFAVTHPHDNRISIMGTDDVTTGIIIIVRHTGKQNTLCWLNITLQSSTVVCLWSFSISFGSVCCFENNFFDVLLTLKSSGWKSNTFNSCCWRHFSDLTVHFDLKKKFLLFCFLAQPKNYFSDRSRSITGTAISKPKQKELKFLNSRLNLNLKHKNH